jgi:prepilin-type N-terminal cleavage/methylation domain-containing protein
MPEPAAVAAVAAIVSHGRSPSFDLVRHLPLGRRESAADSVSDAAGGTVSHRKGFTLTETLIAIVIVGILVLIGYPKVSSAMVTTNVRGARTTIVNLIAKARAVATQSNRRSAQVEFVGNNVLVTATPRINVLAGSPKDTVGGVQNLNAIYGVTVNAQMAAISFDPRGIGTGFNKQSGNDITVTKGGKTQTITIDMLGRVR